MPSQFAVTLEVFIGNNAISERLPIAKRLEEIQKDYHDDYDSDIANESLRTFISLFVKYPLLKMPYISATPNGNLMLEWHDSDNKKMLMVQCLPNQQLRYLAVLSDTTGSLSKVESTTHVGGLMSEITVNHDASWLFTYAPA